jgi:hypothetical protein
VIHRCADSGLSRGSRSRTGSKSRAVAFPS